VQHQLGLARALPALHSMMTTQQAMAKLFPDGAFHGMSGCGGCQSMTSTAAAAEGADMNEPVGSSTAAAIR
jgi:hypothetical protein